MQGSNAVRTDNLAAADGFVCFLLSSIVLTHLSWLMDFGFLTDFVLNLNPLMLGLQVKDKHEVECYVLETHLKQNK